jgi:hypothetical protein
MDNNNKEVIYLNFEEKLLARLFYGRIASHKARQKAFMMLTMVFLKSSKVK